MLQRIQTIWLTISAVLSAFLLGGTVLKCSAPGDGFFSLGFTGVIINTGTSQLGHGSIPVSLTILLIPVLCIVAIGLFRNRVLQRYFVYAVIALNVILLGEIGFYWSMFVSKYSATITPGIKLLFPVIVIVLSFLALSGINKDEKLVKSYDRLR
ncbi:MAG: DUF4293 domain-containing protein [Bacteroidales bacterium]